MVVSVNNFIVLNRSVTDCPVFPRVPISLFPRTKAYHLYGSLQYFGTWFVLER